MKHIYNIAWSFLLVAGLASCEMKNELFEGESSGETGLLQIGVAVNKTVDNVATRAGETETEEGVGVPVEGDPQAADGFKVLLTPSSGSETKSFIYDADGTNSIELPVGTYTVYAHTPNADGGDEIPAVSDAPYYGAKTTVEISNGTTQEVSLNCKMENTRIALDYDQLFTGAFTTWEFTLEAGSYANNFIYNGTGEMPTLDTYVYLGEEGLSAALVHGWATLKDGGNKVYFSKSLSKKDGTNFTGAESINISMSLVEGDVNGSATITIKVEGFGSEPDQSEPVEVPIEVEDKEESGEGNEGEGEEEGTTGEVSIELTKSQCVLPDDAGTTVNANISTPGGLESLYIEIEGGNETFDLIAATLLDGGKFELIDCPNETIAEALKALNVNLPTKGLTEYEFPISAFFSLLDASLMGPTTTEKGHIFHVKVTDKVYGVKEGQVNIIVKATDVTE